MKKIFHIFILLLSVQSICGQKIAIVADGIKSSFRGLSVVNNDIVWVSGSNGTVGKSTNGGKTWDWIIVKDFEKTDFRDIEAFDKKTAVIMGIAGPAYILRTSDGGESWNVVFKDTAKGMFLDAMEFWNDQSGIVIGDPVNGKFFIGRTFDGGKSWRTIPEQNKPIADSGEACFASSGTNIRKLNKAQAVFITGGSTSHIFIRDKKIKIPILQGKESTGANSIAVKNDKIMIVVGGDFTTKDSANKNCVITKDGGNTWLAPKIPPAGYRSCVEYLKKNKWITCGLNGVDISNDEGITWKAISKESFHVCRKAKKGNVVFFAGNNGKIGKLVE
ncbi:MAG: oxidoreductase [Bacteroidota bacterium]|nr:oxidoreductase [Bacteroidota bacterium]